MLLICATAISTGINAAAADDGLGEMVKYSIKCTENNDKVIRFERTIKFRPNKPTIPPSFSEWTDNITRVAFFKKINVATCSETSFFIKPRTNVSYFITNNYDNPFECSLIFKMLESLYHKDPLEKPQNH